MAFSRTKRKTLHLQTKLRKMATGLNQISKEDCERLRRVKEELMESIDLQGTCLLADLSGRGMIKQPQVDQIKVCQFILESLPLDVP